MRRREFLYGASALAAAGTLSGRSAAASTGKHLLVVLVYGGWDPTYCMDPKLGVGAIEGPEYFTDPLDPKDVETVETIHGIPLALNDGRRPAIRRFFEAWGPETVVMNGVYTASIVHEPCKIRMISGTRETAAPDYSVIVGATHSAGPLGSIDMSGRGQPGSLAVSTGRLGEHNQVKGLIDPVALPGAAPQVGVEFPQIVPTTDEEAVLDAFLRDRAARHAAARPHAAAEVAQLEEAWDRANGLVDHPEFGGLLKRNNEPLLRDQIDLAVSVFGEGIAHSVLMDDRTVKWDTHPENESQNTKFDDLFVNLDALARALVDAGLYDDTRVLVMSEMGRTPRHNSKTGKDHWPYTSALWFGGGVRGGRVVGATDELMLGLPIDLASGELATKGKPAYFDNFAAGVLQAMDVDPAAWLPGVAPLVFEP